MTTQRAVRGALFALVIVLAVGAPVSAQPTTDLVEVMAEVSGVFSGPGGYVAQVEWGVRSHEDDPAVSVLLNAYMVFSNNLRKQVFPPEVHTLEPGDGQINVGFVLLPAQAGLGDATFHVEARVLWVQSGGGSGGIATAVVPFDVPLFSKGITPRLTTGPERNCAAEGGGRRRPDRIDRHCPTGFDTFD